MFHRTTDSDYEGLKDRLVGVMLFRVVAISVFLGATILRSVHNGVTFLHAERSYVAIIIFTYVASLGYALLLRNWGNFKLQGIIQLFVDLLLATVVCHLTGHVESQFVVLYPFMVIIAAILFYRPGAFIAASVGSVAIALLSIDMHFPFLPDLPGMARNTSELDPIQTIYVSFVNIFALFMIASLSSYLAQKVLNQGRRLERTEASLLDLAELYGAIVRSIPTGVVTLDALGRITFINRPGCGILERTPEGMVGRTVGEVIPEFLTGGGDGKEFGIRTGEGKVKLISVRSADLYDHLKMLVGSVLVFEDITAYRAMEEVVNRSERLVALGKVAASLAHEIRNPLAAITGSVELLGSGASLDDSAVLMKIVTGESMRLNDLIEKFLQYARPVPPRFEDVDLGQLVNDTVRVFRNDAEVEKRLEIVLEVEEEVAISADPGQVKQMIWNLLKNATQAIEAEGRISIRVGVNHDAEGGGRVEVIDSGSGITQEALPHIFEPFFTTKEKGTGLGLAIVHSIVTSHGGKVSVLSEPGKGSTFTVILAAEPVQAKTWP
ncbi:MAG: ATP-binding protein [Myxococcota bacterium]